MPLPMRSALDVQQTWATFKDWLLRLYDHTALIIENAAQSEANALAYLNDFKGRYYGPLSADPSLDPLGNAIGEGDAYFRTAAPQAMMVYRSGAWVNYEASSVSSAASAKDDAIAANGSRQASDLSATAAAAAKVAAEAARDAAMVTGKLYTMTTAGLANTSGMGDTNRYFSTPSPDTTEHLILWLNNAGTAVEKKRYPSAAALDALYTERLLVSRDVALERKRTALKLGQVAYIVILLGQSNNAPHGTPISGAVSPNVFMPAGGNSVTYFPFNAINALWTCQWNDVATTVPHTEGVTESPASGVALGLLGGNVDRVYICGVARGSQSFAALNSDGNINNLSAVLLKLCDKARADGYEPQVVFDTHHGESDAFLGSTEAAYFAAGTAYYRKAQAMAAIAMDRPDYDAPIVFHMPLAYGTFGSAAAMRNVAKGIVRLSKGIPGGILLGGSFQFATESGDRVHQLPVGARQKGEHGGFLLRQYMDNAVRHQAVQIVDAKWSGTTVTVLFSKEIVRDLTLTYGTSLNAAFALGGLEFLDDAAFIKINSMAIQGRTAVLTLNAVPVGAVKTLQIASQAIAGAAAGADNLPGTQIRAATGGFLSIHDYTRTYLDLAIPQTLEVRAA